MSAIPATGPITSASLTAATMPPPSNLDLDARQDRLDLLWTFVPVTVALGAMTLWLVWSSLGDLSFASVQPAATAAPLRSASAPLPAGPGEHLRATALAPGIKPLHASVDRDTLATDLVSTFALNALLATLIDDDTPPRWTDVAIHHFCGPATRVEIDGKPLVPGDRVPATAFKVRWRMDECWPFDFATVALSGTVDLLVFHEENGLSAVVSADRMVISGPRGASRVQMPFPASLSLANGVNTQ